MDNGKQDEALAGQPYGSPRIRGPEPIQSRSTAAEDSAGRTWSSTGGMTAPTLREAYGAEPLTIYNVEDAFQYHQWDGQQSDAGAQVRDALVNAAKVILRTVPSSPLRTRALNDLVDARMKANAAITFRGRF